MLVVDYLADAADSLALLPRLWGYAVTVAHDGPAALATAAAFRPQAILLDLSMPGMSGGEVAARLRRQPGSGGALLVATSAHEPHDPGSRN